MVRDRRRWGRTPRAERCGREPGALATTGGGRGPEGPPAPPEPSEGEWPADTWVWASGLRDCESMNFCCFKSPSLWSFATVAPGHLHEPLGDTRSYRGEEPSERRSSF